MTNRTNISSGSPYEPIFGFSRAVKVNNQVFVSGCTAIQSDGTVAGTGDPHIQALQALETIKNALEDAGAAMADVVRTRIYVTSMDYFDDVAKAHASYFSDIRPASTGVAVSALAHPDLLVEIEADAVIT
jgi:enamine deaminase RidA (YjgF/YER057c/UK114 family)